MTLTNEQSAALIAIETFLSSNKNVFILTGYAGTGKTTLLQSVIQYLRISQIDRPWRLFAPTGRAAKILIEKTGFGSTIHKGIYKKCSEVLKYTESEDLELHIDVENQENKLIFELDMSLHAAKPIVIVDEASMISSKTNHEDAFQFGSDNLLEDLMTFTGLDKGGQLIFIGDNAQLPPVTDSFSAALSSEYFQKFGLAVATATLSQVLRQGKGSVILRNAMSVRDMIFKDRKERFLLHLDRQQNEFSDIHPSEALLACASNYINTIIITYSNALAKEYNLSVRNIRFPNHPEPVPGDRLLIIKNAYDIPTSDIGEKFDLFNGEFCDLLEVGNEEERLAFVGHNQVSLKFRDVKIRHETGQMFTVKILSNLLTSDLANLSTLESKALFSEFVNRHKHLTRKAKKADFLNALHHDPYFNALQVKYGYAITCHKAQGGEWDTASIDFSGRNGLATEELRWIYTAITRARNNLNLINFTKPSPLAKLTIKPVIKVTYIEPECITNPEVPLSPSETPFHNVNAEAFLKKKYRDTLKVLKPHEKVVSVTSSNYRESYTFTVGNVILRLDTTYNGKHIFKPWSLIAGPTSPETTDLLLRLNTPNKPECQYTYTPSSPSLEYLEELVKECALQSGLTITNIIEHPDNFFVTYYLFSTIYHKIQFYFNDKGDITTAMPSTLGDSQTCKEFHSLLQMIQDSK